MKREEAISLLKDISGSCISFAVAESVSIGKSSQTKNYFLRAKWSVPSSERDCLTSLAQKHGVEISEEKGYTVFSKII